MTALRDVARFAALYPEAAGLIRHNLAGRLDPRTVEYNRGDLPTGLDPDAIPANRLSIAETIRGIENNGS